MISIIPSILLLTALTSHRTPSAMTGRRTAAFFLTTLALTITTPSAAAGVGISKINIQRAGENFETALFYPSEDTVRTTQIGHYDVLARINAPISDGRFPLILLSHGARGSMFSHHDTASYLALSGYIVAAVEHAGDSYRDHSGHGARVTHYRRARQLKATIDSLLEGPYSESIDESRIGVIGYSAGSIAVLDLAGLGPEYCATAPLNSDICGGPSSKGGYLADATTLTDRRIRAAMLWAPLGAIYSGRRLEVPIPVAIIAASADTQVPFERHIKPLVNGLPNLALFEIIPLAEHFIFLAPCSERLKLMKKSLCSDPPGVNRLHQHSLVNSLTASFFHYAFEQQ